LSTALYLELKAFLEDNDVSRTASKPLKDGVEIGVHFHGHPGEYHIVKEQGRLAVKTGPARAPDWTAVISEAAVHHIKALPNPDIGDLGVELLKLMARGHKEPDADAFVKVHLSASFFTMLRHGYLGILPLGGPKVAKFLSERDLISVSGVKRVFKKLRGGRDE
jgi:hypothetical protein